MKSAKWMPQASGHLTADIEVTTVRILLIYKRLQVTIEDFCRVKNEVFESEVFAFCKSFHIYCI